jgi:exonuclease SbcD
MGHVLGRPPLSHPWRTVRPVTSRFLHAADLHLGAPLAALGRGLAADHADALRVLARGAFSNLVRSAMDADVEFVLLAGDVYDEAHREVAAQVRFARGLGQLHEAGIAVFVVHGNHDPLVDSYRPAALLPPNVTVFQPGRVQVHETPLSNGGSVRIAGVSFARTHEHENLAQRFQSISPEGSVCIGVLHANLEGVTGHDPYAPCSVEDLHDAPVAYWALGHVHRRQMGPLAPHRWWAYPGNLQGRSSKPAECGPKGALLVSLTEQGVAEPEFLACDTVRFERLDVEVSEAADVADVVQIVTASVTALAERDVSRPVLSRVRLVGSVAAHHQLVAAREQLLELVRESSDGLLGMGAVLSVEVATRPSVERSRLLERNDLLAELLREIDQLRAGDQGMLDAELARCVVDALDTSTRRLYEDLRRLDPDLALRVLSGVEQRFIDELVEHG